MRSTNEVKLAHAVNQLTMVVEQMLWQHIQIPNKSILRAQCLTLRESLADILEEDDPTPK